MKITLSSPLRIIISSILILLNALLLSSCEPPVQNDDASEKEPPIITRDTTPPTIKIIGENPTQIKKGENYKDLGATANDEVDGSVNVTASGQVDTTAIGKYSITYTAQDKSGNKATAIRMVEVTAIQDTSNFDFTNFGSQYLDKIPNDATVDKYDEERFCMVAGQILSEDGKPITDVQVTIHGHEEYGSVLTDKEGNYSIPAEGGAQLTIRYTKEGYMTVDRQIDAPVQDWVRTPDVVMLPQDNKVTEIKLDEDKPQLHVSTPITDDRGQRSATLVFEKGTTATVTSKDGSTRNLNNIKVRATEFKIPESMPSVLPSTSAYTYCADYTVDGVGDDESVAFDKPVVTYVENFLGFDVGGAVPMGYYDREAGEWKASDDGIVVKLLDTDGDNKIDALDSTGDGKPNDLNSDGNFTDEISGIIADASYSPGKTYWRSEITHFTPWDYNWPYGPPPDAIAPKDIDVDIDLEKENDCKASVNSYITSKTRIFHEDIPVAGTGMSLHYSSKRTRGYEYLIDAFTATSRPASSIGVVYSATIAGRRLTRDKDSGKFKWDGLDHAGNRMAGVIRGKVGIGFVYKPVYYTTYQSFERSWARAGQSSSGITGRETITLWKYKTITVNVDPKASANDIIANGWTVSGHNEAFGRIISKGNGEIEKSDPIASGIINTVAVGSTDRTAPAACTGDHTNDIFRQSHKISIDDNDNLISTNAPSPTSTNNSQHCIQKVSTTGNKKITRIIGSELPGYDGDNNLALNSRLNAPIATAFDSKGNLFIADAGNSVIRKVDTNGIITTIAGDGTRGFLGDGVPAKQSRLDVPHDIEIDHNDNIFIADSYNQLIRKIDQNGIITTVAGVDRNSRSNWHGNRDFIGNVEEIAIDSRGNIFFTTGGSVGVIYKADTSGKVSIFAGAAPNTKGFAGDGGPATEALIHRPDGLIVDQFDNLYFADSANYRVRKIDTHGVITSIAGNGERALHETFYGKEPNGEGGSALDARIDIPKDLAIDSKNNLYITESGNFRIRKVTMPLSFPRYGLDNSQRLYENPNNTADIYSAAGKHQKTIDLVTGKTLKAFSYDNLGRLISVTNQFGQTTTIKRDSQGNPTLIVAPNGQKTWLTVDEQGDLVKVRYEDDSYYSFGYNDKSLMLTETDPQGNEFIHEFNSSGRFIKSIDAMGGEWGFTKNKNGRTTIYRQTMPEGEAITTKDTTTIDGLLQSEVTLTTGDIITSSISKDRKKVTNTADGVSSYLTFAKDGKTQQRILSAKEIKQPDGLTQKLGYKVRYTDDATGNVATKTQTITLNDKPVTTVTDYENGKITSTTAEGRILRAEYDKDTRLTSKITLGSLKPTTFTYDEKGRVKTTGRGTRNVSYTYDTKGNIETVTDPRGKVTTFSYDVMDRLTGILYPDGSEESYRYDNNGNMTKLFTPTPSEFDFAFDGNDNQTALTSPLGKVTEYQYDKNRRLTSITKPSGKKVSNHYINGRLESTATPEGTTQYAYYFGDKIKKLTKGSESFGYEYNGTLPTKINQSGVLNQTISYGYNDDFATTSLSYAGSSTDFAYDKDGLLIQSGRYQLTRDPGNGYTTKLTDGNLVQNISYNDYGEITKLGDNTFTYSLSERDNTGAITQKKETLNGETVIYDYIFDTKGRLTDVKKDNQLVEKYVYDNNGNRTEATVNGITTSATYNRDDQLKSYGDNTYAYDADGYLTKKFTPEGTTTYEYGILGELRKVVTPDKTIEYLHDANDQRVAKKVNGEIVEKYLWGDLTTLFAVYDKDDNLLQRFEYAEQRMPVSMLQDGDQYYLHYDQVGSLRAVTDSNHAIIKEIVYDTYGNVLRDTNPEFSVPFGFAGGLYDPDTQLTRFGLRDYDSFVGRWTAKDPIDFAGGDTNLYGYVGTDPVNWIDPNGKFGLVGAILGGGINLAFQLAMNGGRIECVDWWQVAFDAGLGAIGGGLTNGLFKGAFKFRIARSIGGKAPSYTWGATKAWAKRQNIKVFQLSKNQHRHHWLLQQNQGWGKHAPDWLKNQPWNINSVSASFNNWMSKGATNWRSLLGAPPWARGVSGGTALSVLGATFGGNNCACKR